MEEHKIAIVTSKEVMTKFNDVIQKIDAINANCKAIQIIDVESNERAVELATLANKVSKAVEDKRKLLKKPYKDAGDLIDETAKQIVGDLNKTITEMKVKIKAFDDDLKAKKEKAAKDLEEKLAAQKEMTSIELEDLQKANVFVTDITDETITGLAKSLDAPETIDEILTKFPKPSTFGTAIEIVRKFRTLMLELKDTLEAKKLGSVQAKKDHAKKFNELVNFSSSQFEKVEEAIKNEATAETIGTISKMTDVDSLKSGANTREKWVYEIKGFDQIPLEFLTVDDAAVKKFMKENEDKETGTIKGEIPGIIFKKDSIVVLR